MITIQRNETKLKVSKGAFDLYYKGIGFKVVGVKAEKPEEETEKEPKEENKAPITPKNENPKK
jgi:hypothetical protein